MKAREMVAPLPYGSNVSDDYEDETDFEESGSEDEQRKESHYDNQSYRRGASYGSQSVDLNIPDGKRFLQAQYQNSLNYAEPLCLKKNKIDSQIEGRVVSAESSESQPKDLSSQAKSNYQPPFGKEFDEKDETKRIFGYDKNLPSMGMNSSNRVNDLSDDENYYRLNQSEIHFHHEK